MFLCIKYLKLFSTKQQQMSDRGTLIHKMHQLQKRVTRALKNEGEKISLKTQIRLNRIKKIQEKLRARKL